MVLRCSGDRENADSGAETRLALLAEGAAPFLGLFRPVVERDRFESQRADGALMLGIGVE